jgi:NADH-quinone oxidoreductase subunit L
MLIIAAFGTAFYVGRQLWLIFFGKARHEAAGHAQESPAIITVPLIILAILTVLGGLLNFPYLSEARAERAEEAHDLGLNVELEQWLEESLPAFELSEAEELAEALLSLPKTPINVIYEVAILSTVLAFVGLGLAWLVYRHKPETATDPDPLERTPIWWFGILPLNTLYYRVFVPAFNRSAAWLADTLDWRIWHDWFHDRVVRDSFVGFARWLTDKFDTAVIDDLLVNGSGRAAAWFAGALRVTQTGYVRNYALAVILGVVALLTYFIFLAN